METIFFPRSDYNVEVCKHRLGKKMTYTDCTDTLSKAVSYGWVTALAKARGIKLSFFASYNELNSSSFPTDIRPDLDNGDIWIDVYSRCPAIEDKLNPNLNITEQEWDSAYNDYILPAYYGAVGKKPVALSYAFGNDTFKDYVIPMFLGARNSDITDNTNYGVGCGSPSDVPYSITNNKSVGSTFRWYDTAVNHGNFSELIAQVASKIDETLIYSGWFVNFTHYHSVVNAGHQQYYEDYLDMLAAKNTNSEIYFAGYGEALAYLVYRQMITKVAMYSPTLHPNDQLVIRLETKNTLGIDTDLLQVPISVKFSTVGTPLVNQTIKCSNRNLINIGNGDYIVEMPYDRFPVALIEKA